MDLWPSAVDCSRGFYNQGLAPRKRDRVSLNGCAPVCVNVLAKPVTNSVYHKAAMSLLPRQGSIPTGGCVGLRELSLQHVPSVLSLLHISSRMFPRTGAHLTPVPQISTPLSSPALYNALFTYPGWGPCAI